MKIITFLNEKGGVGKTTTSIHAAAGLALRGYRVLVIDADAQSNATLQLRGNERGGLYNLLVKSFEWRDVIQVPPKSVWGGEPDSQGSLWLLDSNLETRAIPLMVDNVRELQERLSELESYIDAVVIDTAPTPSLLHAMVYLASDYMVYPTQLELLALSGLARSVSHMKRGQNTRLAFGLKPTELLGVVPCMYQANTVAHKHGLALLKKQFGAKVWEPIKQRTVFREAAFDRKTLFSYEPGGEAATELQTMVNRVVKGITA